MTPAQKAANRRVYEAARQVQQAAQYGINAKDAQAELTKAREAVDAADRAVTR